VSGNFGVLLALKRMSWKISAKPNCSSAHWEFTEKPDFYSWSCFFWKVE